MNGTGCNSVPIFNLSCPELQILHGWNCKLISHWLLNTTMHCYIKACLLKYLMKTWLLSIFFSNFYDELVRIFYLGEFFYYLIFILDLYFSILFSWEHKMLLSFAHKCLNLIPQSWTQRKRCIFLNQWIIRFETFLQSLLILWLYTLSYFIIFLVGRDSIASVCSAILGQKGPQLAISFQSTKFCFHLSSEWHLTYYSCVLWMSVCLCRIDNAILHD